MKLPPKQWRFKVSEHWKIKQNLVTKNENKNFITYCQNSIFKATHSSTIIEKA